jgi:predicted phosphoribosyltransferase
LFLYSSDFHYTISIDRADCVAGNLSAIVIIQAFSGEKNLIFQSRIQAGEKLAAELLSLDLRNPVVLAVPRGGVPVAGSVAKVLNCPLDVIPLIKIPIPWSPEASYGAAASDGTLALNLPLMHRFELSEREVEIASRPAIEEVRKREQLYRNGKPFPPLNGKSVIIVDDGLGSGYSMLAAVEFAKKKNPRMVVATAPVASDSAFRMLAALPHVNLLIALVRDAEQVFSPASYYKDFAPVSDNDVLACLAAFKH